MKRSAAQDHYTRSCLKRQSVFLCFSLDILYMQCYNAAKPWRKRKYVPGTLFQRAADGGSAVKGRELNGLLRANGNGAGSGVCETGRSAVIGPAYACTRKVGVTDHTKPGGTAGSFLSQRPIQDDWGFFVAGQRVSTPAGAYCAPLRHDRNKKKKERTQPCVKFPTKSI